MKPRTIKLSAEMSEKNPLWPSGEQKCLRYNTKIPIHIIENGTLEFWPNFKNPSFLSLSEGIQKTIFSGQKSKRSCILTVVRIYWFKREREREWKWDKYLNTCQQRSCIKYLQHDQVWENTTGDRSSVYINENALTICSGPASHIFPQEK